MPRKVKQKKTQISISLSSSLVKRIDKLANEEHRNRSNFITNALTKIVEDRGA